MRERFNTLSFPLALGEQPQYSMHSSTRVESEEQVDYSIASRSIGGLGAFVDEYDADYFTLQPDAGKFSHLRLDESRGDLDKPLPPMTTTPKIVTPLEPTTTMPSSTPSACGSDDNFLVVAGVPSTIQYENYHF